MAQGKRECKADVCPMCGRPKNQLRYKNQLEAEKRAPGENNENGHRSTNSHYVAVIYRPAYLAERLIRKGKQLARRNGTR